MNSMKLSDDSAAFDDDGFTLTVENPIFLKGTPEALPKFCFHTITEKLSDFGKYFSKFQVLTCVGAMVGPFTILHLPPLWDAATILLVFLLALCFLHTPHSLFDGISSLTCPSIMQYPFSLLFSWRRRKKRRRRRSKWHGSRYMRVHRKHLPYGMGIRVRRRNVEQDINVFIPEPYLCRKRVLRNLKARHRYKTSKFLRPDPPSNPLAKYGTVSADVLSTFCENQSEAFLKFPRLMKRLNSIDHQANVQKLIKRFNYIRVALKWTHTKTATTSCSSTAH